MTERPPTHIRIKTRHHTDKIWIVTFGRAGSTCVFSILKILGCDVGYKASSDNFSEHPKLVEINEYIIESLYRDLGHPQASTMAQRPDGWFLTSPPEGWHDWLFNDEHPDIANYIQENEKHLPPILKDPRWSITLPLWYRYAVTLPQHIIYLDRDINQAVNSWILRREISSDQGIECLKIKRRILNETLDNYAYRGIDHHYFEFPHFIRRPKKLIKLFADMFNEDVEMVARVVMLLRDKSQMHKYEHNEKGELLVDYYDPGTKETIFVAVDVNYESIPSSNDKAFQMLQSISCKKDAGIKQVESMRWDAYNTEFRYEDTPYKED